MRLCFDVVLQSHPPLLDNTRNQPHTHIMTIAEIKSAIDEMVPEEKLTVEVYARASTLVDTRSFQREMQTRANEMTGGQSFSSKTVRELHDLLSQKGL